jgi:hypothetical protein
MSDEQHVSGIHQQIPQKPDDGGFHVLVDRRNVVSKFDRILLTLIPTLVGVLVMAGGWVYNYATTQAQIHDLDKRITIVEQNYIPASVHVERDRLLAEKFEQINRRLDKIDEKLDDLPPVLNHYIYRKVK